jgi:ribosomal-protein-alanine N-acetyltransferase
MTTENIYRLRPFRESDADALVPLANDAEVSRYLQAHFPFPYSRRNAEMWLEKVVPMSVPANFAIEVDGALAGGLGFTILNGSQAGVAEIGYWLGRPYWGRGIMTEALQSALRYGFGRLDVRRIQSMVMAPNVASAHVLEKSGFTLEGRLTAYYIDRENNIHDALLYRILKTESTP